MSTIQLFAEGDDLNARVAARMRSLRGLFSLNQTQLAQVIDISQSQMSKRLRGVTPFTLMEIEAFASYFGTTAGYLLGYEEGPAPRDPLALLRTRRDSNPKPSVPESVLIEFGARRELVAA